jgi:Putative peptidoglycan binding domain
MKKIVTLLAGFSLALAGAVIAQQPEGQESPAKKGGGKEKTEHATETKPARNAAPGEKKANAANAEKPTTTETGVKQHGARGERNAKGQTATNAETSPAAESNASPQAGGKKGRQGRNAKENAAAETGATASPGASQPMEQGKKGRQGRAANARTSSSPAASAAAATSVTPATSATVAGGATGATGASAMTKEQGTVGRGGKKVEQQQVQQIKQQHASFRAQPRPDKAPAVTFNANFRISGAERWQGPQYEVFRSYHPEWHDRGWYRSRYGRVELIGGGYYYWNGGYWYPAWGYDSSAAYYPYDGPIYVGRSAEPPDRVIADVQSELQQMGYYQGEVDGLLGPMTRQALRDYQADHGLEVTEAIDEPTLDALQLS